VLNCGSSSVKYRLYDMGDAGSSPDATLTGAASVAELADGHIERIGEEISSVRQRTRGKETNWPQCVRDYQQAFEVLARHLMQGPKAPLAQQEQLSAVGHRVVHGGERFVEPAVIDEAVIRAIRDTIHLAPLHNPANLAGIDLGMNLFPDVPHVAVFDTAFHHAMPRHAYLYAIPYELYVEHGVRRYGFHGTSHRYAAAIAAEMLERDLSALRLITCHLGNGCSIAAIAGGVSVDTSMGLTPLEGVPMGTRSGDVDPGLFFHLHHSLGMEAPAVDELLNKRSGLLGLSNVSNDLRPIEQAAAAGEEQAELCLEVLAYRVKKYIGAYLAVLGGADAVVFTGGMGEHSASLRARICAGLEALGLALDDERNEACIGEAGIISRPGGSIAALVIPSNEELLIARDTLRLASAGASSRV
jgi:acetate kinase